LISSEGDGHFTSELSDGLLVLSNSDLLGFNFTFQDINFSLESLSTNLDNLSFSLLQANNDFSSLINFSGSTGDLILDYLYLFFDFLSWDDHFFLELDNLGLEFGSGDLVLNNHFLQFALHDLEVGLADLGDWSNSELHLFNGGLIHLSGDFTLDDLSSKLDSLLDVGSSGDLNLLHLLLDFLLVDDWSDLTLVHLDLQTTHFSIELSFGDKGSALDLVDSNFVLGL